MCQQFVGEFFTLGRDQSAVDWASIEQRVRAGESARSIARDLRASGMSISHVAISARAKREGWLADGTAVKAVKGHTGVKRALARTKTARIAALPQTHQEKMLKSYGLRTPENAAAILEDIGAGAPLGLAAQRRGISRDALLQWRKDDPTFGAMVDDARHGKLVDWHAAIDEAAQKGHWQAAARLLETAEETGERWGRGGGGGTVNVVINVERRLEDHDGPTIDAEAAHPPEISSLDGSNIVIDTSAED